MRTRKIPIWVCGAILCCAVPAALCQDLGGSLAAGTGLSSGSSDGGNAPGSIGSRSEVSASVSSTMDTGVQASLGSEAVSADAVNGAGGGGSSTSSAAMGKAVSGRLDFGVKRGLFSNQLHPDLKTKAIAGRPALHSSPTTIQYRMKQAEQRGSGRMTRSKQVSAKKPAAGGQSGGTYSGDFQDSTKGTALLSPPDHGTQSPLEWSPGLSYGFGDFTGRQFLNPSLRGGHSLRKGGRAAARKSAGSTVASPGDVLNAPSWSTSLGDSLQPNLPDSYDPLQDLGMQ